MRLADLQVEVSDGVVVANLSGEVDMSNVDEIGASLAGHVTNDALGLVIDFSELRYLDSAGIQLLYELRERLRNRGQKLAVIVPPGSPTARTLELVNAVDLLGMTSTAAEATSAITGAKDA